MLALIQDYCDTLVDDFNKIPEERIIFLEKISDYISKKRLENQPVNLVYICTHNSRRSHFGQIWAKVASYYYEILGVNTYSGGTEITAFHPNAMNALTRVGFKIKRINADKNPTYHVFFDENASPVKCFSKMYDAPENPKKDFVAIMTCSDAEENCPFIPGVELRVATAYDDPKAYDDTELQDMKYDERCRQIALETLYVFSKL
jgi:arsenate reductase